MAKPEHTVCTNPLPQGTRDARPHEITAAVGHDAPTPLRVMLDRAHRITFQPHHGNSWIFIQKQRFSHPAL